MSIGRALALVASVALSAGGLTALGVGAGTAAAATPTITAVGVLADADATPGPATLSVTPATVGDAFVLGVRVASPTTVVSTVTGGGSTWVKLGNTGDGTRDVELWLGTITTVTGSAEPINISYSAAVTSTDVELIAQEYSSALGATTVWTLDTAGGTNTINEGATSTTVPFPTLVPGAGLSHELYAGYSIVTQAGAAGSTAGYTYKLTTGNNNVFTFNGNISASTSPTATQSPAGTSISMAALINANLPVTTVTGVSPNAGPITGGTSVNITGTNFTGTPTVSFGGTAGTGVVLNSATSITAVSPAHAAGTVDVVVTDPGGPSATSSADQFTFGNAPAVSSLSPTSGPAGTSVIITGANLSGATAVKFGTTAATGFTINSATQISAVAPAGTGTVDVTVTTPTGTSATNSGDKYTFTAGANSGYWMVGKDGGVFAFGNAGFVGSLPGIGVHVSDIVGVVPTATGKGYWMVGADGGVFAFGDAGFVGSLPGIGVHVSDIVGVVPTATGKGYWMVGADGGVFAFGDAGFVGSLPGDNVHVNDIVGVVPTATGKGYWMVGKDGGVFAFGDAGFVGSLPGLGVHVSDIVGVVATSTGKGYWMVGKDGGVFAFGDAGFVGSLPGLGVHVTNIVGVVATHTGKGYWMVGADGGVFAFGDAGFVGSLPGIGVHVSDIVAVVPTATVS